MKEKNNSNSIYSMKTKIISLSVALLMGMSVWADDVWNCNVQEDCSKNGYEVSVENGHAWVDLGLPSGLKWASCNVGAEKPEEYGAHYAWGEVLPKADYSLKTYKYANGTSWNDIRLTKYCTNTNYSDNGFIDGKTTLEPEDDAAHVNWGSIWRMPTDAEWKELKEQCTLKWRTVNNVKVCEVTSKINGNSILLPAAGFYADENLEYIDYNCDYWSSSLDENYNTTAHHLYLCSGDVCSEAYSRWCGYSIRPVFQSLPSASDADYHILTVYAAGCERANVITCRKQVSITAVPQNAQHHFVRWSDGNIDNPRLVTVTQDMTLTAEFAQSFSGQCGDNLYWAYGNHTLTITGTGAMYDYNEDNLPWLLFRDTTDVIVLPLCITHIGNNAFNGFVKLGKIELPSTLNSIGTNAFAGCRKLYDIYAYPIEPPVADNTSFANYNVNLYVPCDNLRDYQMDAVFGTFKYIQCMSTTDTEQVQTETSTEHTPRKVFRDGQVYILRGGKTYTLMGVEVNE